MPQVRPGDAMETLPAPEDDREAKSQRQPLPSVKLQGWNHREQHHRHGKNDGNDQSGANFRRVILGGNGRRRDTSPVASSLDHPDEVVDLNRLGGEDMGLASRVVDGGLDPINLVELLGDAGGARCATHTCDVEVDGGRFRRVLQLRLRVGVSRGKHVFPSWTTHRNPGCRGLPALLPAAPAIQEAGGL